MDQLKKNQIIPLTIDALGSQGEGIGRHNGMAVFVPAAAPGDKIEARLLKVKKNLAYAKIESITDPSADRMDSGCAAYPQCGGCAYRHITYEAECRAKEQRVTDAMRRIGGIDITPERFVACDTTDRYRNKAQLPCRSDREGRPCFGFFAGHTHRVVRTDDCALQPEGYAAIAAAVAEYMTAHRVSPYDETAHKGIVRHLYMRRSVSTGQIMVCLVINASSLPAEEELVHRIRNAEENVSGVLVNVNRDRTNVILGHSCRLLWGSEYITDSLLGVSFGISPLSFFQVNPLQAERLYAIAAEYAGVNENTTLLDMYCGAGTIGLTMAGRVKRLIGVEIVAPAVEDARLNAQLNGITNAEFICADAAQAAAMLTERGERPDVIIVDPPRKGCDEALLDCIAQLSPERLVYVSCDPATLARDCARMAERGYTVSKLSAVDMFPRTVHVETVVLLSRKKPDDVIHIDLELDKLDITSAESKATYQEIKDYVLENFGLKVSALYISQVKRKLGIEVGESYNKAKSDTPKVPNCPKEKEDAIVAALKHFGMI